MATLTEDHVREALRQVIDPELFINIVDLGLIYDIAIESGAATGGATEAATEAVTEPAVVPEVALETATEVPAMSEDASPAETFRVKIEMTMTSPMCPAGPQLVGQSKEFVSKLAGVEKVDVKVVMNPPWTPEKMTEEARDQLGIF